MHVLRTWAQRIIIIIAVIIVAVRGNVVDCTEFIQARSQICVQRVGTLILKFCFQATSKVISGQVQTCDSAHSFGLYSVAPLGNQAADTMTLCPTQLHYPHTELTSPCPILLMSFARQGSENYEFYKSLFDSTKNRNPDLLYAKPKLC